MASISIPTAAIIATSATAVGTGVAAYSSHEQGVAASNEAKQKARAEGLNAAQKQINMRQNMLKALGAQAAGTLGAVGTGRGTGFGANTMRQITQSQNDLMANSANSSAQISLLDQQGANAAAAGNLGAATAVLGGVPKIVGMG